MIFEIIVGALVGLAVGAAYFQGLWWTVQRVVDAGRPGLLLASFVLRGVVAIAVAALLIVWSLPAFVASGITFAIARRILLSRHRRAVT